MKNKMSILALALTSIPAFAGTMGPVGSEKYFLIEGGLAYTHAFYKSSAVFPESVTTVTPNGFAINPSDFYPNDFFGGYAGMSFYFPDWLVNARYSLYEHKLKVNTYGGTAISIQPAKLSLTADRVWGNFHLWSFGLGGGAVLESVDQGRAFVSLATNNPASESLQGNSIVNPLVEGFVMYRFANNFGAKFNLEYQIPVSSTFGNGDLNLSLGLNYAWPV